MADNTQLATMTGGDLCATDDIASGVAAGAKVQRVKNGFGVDGAYSDVGPDNGLPVAGAYTELTGSASANATDLIASTDVRAYRSFSLQLTGTFSATVAVQGSNDGTTWVAVPIVGLATASPILASSASSPNVYVGAVPTRYLRVRTTAYTSGTATATLELAAEPATPVSVYAYASSANPATVDTELPAAATLADAATNPSAPMAGAAGLLYNGSTWDRARTANGASGTTGTGMPAAGSMGYDGTNWQRLKASTAGELQTNQAGAAASAVTSVAGSVSNVSLLAANTARKQATVYNESTANLYLKLGATASVTSYTVKVAAGGYYELPHSGYTGAVDGIWDAANGNARITELS